MSSSLRSITSHLQAARLGGPAFTLQVVLIGKLKPIEFLLYEVLSDGIRAQPSDAPGPQALYPYTAIQSISVVYA